jgi:hypothetical protein
MECVELAYKYDLNKIGGVGVSTAKFCNLYQ